MSDVDVIKSFNQIKLQIQPRFLKQSSLGGLEKPEDDVTLQRRSVVFNSISASRLKRPPHKRDSLVSSQVKRYEEHLIAKASST